MALIGIHGFPKSGNTWLMSIVANLFGGCYLDVLDVHKEPQAPPRRLGEHQFYKSHHGYLPPSIGNVSTENAYIIHIRRHPLDVFVSYLNFLSRNVTSAAALPFDSVEQIRGTPLMDIYLDNFILQGQFSNFSAVTKSYYDHNLTWLRIAQSRNSVLCLKYEDLSEAPERTLAPIVEWLQLDNGQIGTALDAANTDTGLDGRFFWKQRAGNFRNYLSQKQVDRFLEYRGEVCETLGYPQIATKTASTG